MAGDIGNAFCILLYAENIWSTCGQYFGEKCGAIVVLERALYGLKTTFNSFCNVLGDFLRDIGFNRSRKDQDLWLRESDK